MKKYEDELPPFSLEEAKEWLHTLEDVATIARDSEYASRIMLLHLFKHLHAGGTIDGKRFIDELTVGLYLVEKGNHRLALSVLLEELGQALQETNVDPHH